MIELNKDEILKKYYREIKLTKIRIIEMSVRLSKEEKENLIYSLNPRNKAEIEIKENYMGFLTQRILEGNSTEKAKKLTEICINEAIRLAKEELL